MFQGSRGRKKQCQNTVTTVLNAEKCYKIPDNTSVRSVLIIVEQYLDYEVYYRTKINLFQLIFNDKN